MPGIYRQVEERLKKGMNITTATQEGDAESSQLVDRDEDYNTRYGGYMGYVMAFERLKPIPRHAPDLDLVRMVTDAGATDAPAVVNYFVERFLRVDLPEEGRSELVRFLDEELGQSAVDTADARTEAALRSLLYLVMSTPQYQLA